MLIPGDEIYGDFEITDEEEEDELDRKDRELRRYDEDSDIAARFLGEGKKLEVPVGVNHYYEFLLAWTLKCCIRQGKWKVVRVLGQHRNLKPDYVEVNIAPGKNVYLLANGKLLLKRGETRLAARIRFSRHCERAWIAVEGLLQFSKEIRQFAAEIDKTVKKLELYRGQKLEYVGVLTFLKPTAKGWDDLALTAELKEELMDNTVGFLRRSREMAKYGIPRKRGLILAGKPGTGKTLISKVIMNNSGGITCLATDPALLVRPLYIREIYEIATDLKPSIVFLEDIDLIGESRGGMGSRGEALNELLDILDGVRECNDVVTIATTNFAESLDDALSQRPSRFDRIITIRPPDRDLRRQIVHNLCRRIPLEPSVQEHIVRMTEGYTPAQVQEVVYGLVIQSRGNSRACRFTREDVDGILHRINRRNSEPIGFKHREIYGGSSDGSTVCPH